MAAEDTVNIFSDTMSTTDVQAFTLMRGVTDFSNLAQYDLYETGYSFLINLSIPKFLKNAKSLSDEYKKLINNYCHIIEYDFRGMSGIDDIVKNDSYKNEDDILIVTSGVNLTGFVCYFYNINPESKPKLSQGTFCSPVNFMIEKED